eukprot:gene18318-biopygen12265
MKESKTLVFYVNGKKVVDDAIDPEWTLLSYLRLKLGYRGTKLGCAEGGCGACTVMVSKYDREKGKIEHLSVNACLAPVCSMHGLAVTTVEGIGSTRTKLHAVQETIAKSHGSQCGFCTPGIVMSMYTLLRNNPKPSMQDIDSYLQGNLCRCTGYRPILEGFRSFTADNASIVPEEIKEGCCVGAINGKCCQLQNGVGSNENGEEGDDSNEGDASFMLYCPKREPIFPPELQLSSIYDEQHLVFCGKRMTWYRPTCLEELLLLKSSYPQGKIVVGNTELGVEMKFKNCEYPVMIVPTSVQELTSISEMSNGVKFGASVTLSKTEEMCQRMIAAHPHWKVQVFAAVLDMMQYFAGKQVRNVGALGGNIMTGSPISDLNPIFMAAGCMLEVAGPSGIRNIKMDGNFFTGYRRNVIQPEELLLSITLPFTDENDHFKAYKQSKRRDDDIAIVNAAFKLKLIEGVIDNITICYGGMAPTTIMVHKAMAFLRGKNWCSDVMEEAFGRLIEDVPLAPDVPGAMVRYRQSLALSFLFKFYISASASLDSTMSTIRKDTLSAIEPLRKGELKSHQLYERRVDSESKFAVGAPLVHTSSLLQATGEAVYCDDMPKFENELYLAFVLSTKAHAYILSINADEALQMDGVVNFVCHKDLSKDNNKFGLTNVVDEEVFASEKVSHVGQIIGTIIATDQTSAKRAAKVVQISYKELPAIVTIEEAIKAESFHVKPVELAKGSVEDAFKNCDHVLNGEMRTGAQEQFYLETQATIAVPKGENGEMEIFSSTQNPTSTQSVVAKVLGVPANRIVCRVKRIGGGFGGKETRSIPISAAVAVAANKVGRPVRIMLDRDEDMLISGTRHPFYASYKVGFNKDGQIKAFEVDLYNNCGMMVGENMMNNVALFLGKEVENVRQKNLLSQGQLTHYNQEIESETLINCWNECLKQSSFYQVKEEVKKFNAENKWKKRGISIIPTKYGISFAEVFLNQAGALINVYIDGSVLLSHGGVEMGQGLYTKTIQIVSETLKVDVSKIHVLETATDKVPNTSPTAASSGSDLNGMAAYNACLEINKRLKPFRKENVSWEEAVHSAYFARVSLFATGFYATPNLNYDWNTNSGRLFAYHTTGAACSVVEIDCLTGDHQVLKTDIVMDVGQSLNPAIDIGQIEGAFTQGYGLFMMEQLVHSPSGVLLTRGPGAYKIPSFNDVPTEFNVSLLKGSLNPHAVYSSKAIGEPPLFLASSVFFAAKDAIIAARDERGLSSLFQLDAPATCERIRMACEDEFTQRVPLLQPDDKL